MVAVVNCPECSPCGILLVPGFCSEQRLWCTELLRYVEPTDGCTFGGKGEPTTATDGVFVTLNDHECVSGDYGIGCHLLPNP